MAKNKKRQQAKGFSTRQWFVLISLAGALVVMGGLGVAAGKFGKSNPIEVSTVQATERLAVASVSPLNSNSSSWYCNWYMPGTGGLTKVSVLLANTSSKGMSATLKTYVGKSEQSRSLTVPPHSFLRYPQVVTPTNESGAISFVANGGGTLAELEISGPLGSAIAPCNSSPSAHWVALGANTLPGSESGISIFNPFAQDAVVDVAFSSQFQQFAPGSLQGLVIAPHASENIDLTQYFSGRTHVAISVSTRIGRVVLGGVVGRNDKGNAGLSALATFPATGSQWNFPVGELSTNQNQEILIYNPNSFGVTTDLSFSYLDLKAVSTGSTTSTTSSSSTTTVVRQTGKSQQTKNTKGASNQSPSTNNLTEKIAANSVAVVSVKAQTAVANGKSYSATVSVKGGFGVVAAEEFIGSLSTPNSRYQVVGGSPLTTQHWIALYDPSIVGISQAQAWLATIHTGRGDPEAQKTPLVDLGPTYLAPAGQPAASLPTEQALLAQTTSQRLNKSKKLNSVGALSPEVTGMIVSSKTPFALGSVMGQSSGDLYVVPVIPFAN